MKSFIAALMLAVSMVTIAAQAAEPTPIELQEVGIQERLGEPLSLDLPFVDELGEAVTLRRYFDGAHPVILAFVYYECPNLCTLLLNGLTGALRQFDWTPGERYRVVTVSIDPRETHELASTKKAAYLDELKRPTAAAGWHFLTGRETDIQQLARQAGFSYRYDEDQGQFAHAAALIMLTPDARISRYLYGIQFEPRDLRLGLLEAANGKIGTIMDRLLLYCYHYDPKGRKYALFATRLMKIGGMFTLVILAVFFYSLSARSRRKNPHAGPV